MDDSANYLIIGIIIGALFGVIVGYLLREYIAGSISSTLLNYNDAGQITSIIEKGR